MSWQVIPSIITCNIMKTIRIYRQALQRVWWAVFILPGLVQAQYFVANTGDLLIGFRKYNPAGSYELVVNAGNVANLLAMSPGSSMAISQLTSTELARSFATNFNNLHWSVAASVNNLFGWNGFPYETIWFTLPRSSPGAQTAPPARQPQPRQAAPTKNINSIGNGAYTLSSYGSPATNQDNNAVLIREPAGDANSYSTFAESSSNPFLATYNDSWSYNVENVTPASFTSAVVSDLYQSVPTGYNDPTTGTNSGTAYYVGYFTLNPNGTMTFTRASVATIPPPSRIVSLMRSGNTSTIYFTTTNGNFTYRLYYTNAAGLGAVISNWPALPATLFPGNGLTNSFSDTTTDLNRFYRIGVQ